MKEVKIKSNGIRNELKEIRKSIDKLTSVLEVILEISHSEAIKHTHRYDSSDKTNTDHFNLPDDRYGDSRLNVNKPKL